MTSTNDGKEVKSIQTSGPKGKTYFIELYKSLEARLSEAATASERTSHLCEAWRKVYSLCQHSAPTTHPHLLSWLQRHTARAVLQTKWQSPDRKDERSSLEEAINIFIVESKTATAVRDGYSPPWQVQLVARGEWFKRVLDNPWKHPVLNCLLNPDGTPPTNDEVLEWLKEERGVTFVMRLHTLVAEKCDDIAMSLATAVMERVRADTTTISDVDQSEEAKDKPENKEQNFGSRLKEEAGFTTDVWELLTDIEFVLLHKRDSSRCITLAKKTPLRSAYQLIERLQSRLETSPREKRLWKNSKEVAVLIAQVVIARCMVVPHCTGGARSALYCCARSLARLMAVSRLPTAAAALAAPAPTAAHLHTLAAAVDAQLAQKNETSLKPFVCELYVRAITAGMNELERLKLKTEKDTEARSMEQTLASWFVQLGAVLGTSDRVKCECALTAFSVHPSPQMYERIKAAPALPPIHLDVEQASTEATNPEFGSWASDSRSQTNFVKTSETLNMKARQNQANVLSTAILTEGEALGLSPELCQDITVLLSGPRVKTLSWDMDRELLLDNCRGYLERTHGGTKAVTTELKYLNLNPADYQDLPEEDEDESNIYYGIEKGYEHLVEFQEPEDIWEEAYENYKQVGSSYSSDEFDFIQPQQRKKRTKAKQVSKTEEDDPLSLVAENKRKEKKERPHSKERSKNKVKHTDLYAEDPLGTQEGNQEKKEKPKRERKKKVKPTDGTLANLVGLKVANTKNEVVKQVPHTESDGDSQGRSSIQSVHSDDNVVYDGTYSMDEMRSPRSSHSSDGTGMFNNDLTKRVGVLSPSPKIVFNRPHRPSSMSGVRMASPSPAKSQSPSDHSRNNSPTFISDDVKNSISKLLEFRRQKASEHERKKANAISRRDGSIAMDKINISPKAVAIPDIPKSYISKQGDRSLLNQKVDDILKMKSPAIPSPVIQYAKKSPVKPNPSRNQYKMHVDQMTPSADRCFSTPPSSERFLDSVNLISIYDKNYQTHTPSPYDKTPTASAVQERRSNADTSFINYQDYLHEFSLNSFNEYVEKRDATRNAVRPMSRVTPVVPNMKSEHKSPQSAKHMPQKKPDGSLNTFSRMSYYKNKQTDMRNKSQDMSQQGQPRTVGSKLDGFIMEHLFQTQSGKPQGNDFEGTVGKHEKPQTNAADHPMLANILQSGSPKTQNEQKPTSLPKSVLSDKDHNDLILLLRQQSMLNKPKNLPVASCSNSVNHGTLNSTAGSSAKTINSSTSVYDSNATHVSSNHTPKHQIAIGKPDEAHKSVNEGKIINILSTSIIKSADQKTKNPKSANTKKPVQEKSKKTEGSKKPVSKPESQKDPEEWENVMDAILKQKTPCRGPNALAIALNKSSFEKAFEDSLRKPSTFFNTPKKNITESATSRIEFNHEKLVNVTKSTASSFSISQTVVKTEITEVARPPNVQNISSLIKKSLKMKKPGNTPVEVLMKQNKINTTTIEQLMKHNRIEITNSNSCIAQLKYPEKKYSDIEKSKRDGLQQYAEMTKMNKQQQQVKMSKMNVQQSNVKLAQQNNVELPVKHVHTNNKPNTGATPKKEIKQVVNTQIKNVNYVNLKQNDSFVAGILNSDYDLLDELIDDDLRKEIGELSSDEESYNSAQNFLKQAKTDEKRVSTVYNHVNELSCATSLVRANNARPSMCKQNDMSQSFAQKPAQRPQSKKAPVKSTSAKPAQSNSDMGINTTNEQIVATHTESYSTQVPSYNSASLLRSNQVTMEPNVYIAAVPRPPPVQNVMLIPSDLVYEGYSTIQTPIPTVPNLAPNTYIPINNSPVVNVYQTTQFGTSVVNPLINAIAVAAPVVNNVPCAATVQPTPLPRASGTQYSYSSHELHQSSHLATVKGNIVVDGSKLEAKVTSNVANRHLADKDITQQPETKTPSCEGAGKSGERKVLKEVQEKHADEKMDCKRILKVSDNEFKTQANLERVKKKRMDILNRKTSMFCGVQTIALGYSPLKLKTQMENKVDLSDKQVSMDDLIPLTQNNLPDLSSEVKSPATPESFKENKNELIVRRILLRSSNKLKSKIISSTALPKPSVDNKLKELPPNPLHISNETLSENNQSNIETNRKGKRVSKRIRNKSLTAPKDANNKETNSPRKKTTGTSKVFKKRVCVVSRKTKNPAPRQVFNTQHFFDIETELLGSTIPKIKPIDLHDPSSEISSTVSTEEKIEESMIPDKKEATSLKSTEEINELMTHKMKDAESPESTKEEMKKSMVPDKKDSSESTGKTVEDLVLPGKKDKSPESTEEVKILDDKKMPDSTEKMVTELVLTDKKDAKTPESTGERIIQSMVPDKKVECLPIQKDLTEQYKEDLLINKTIIINNQQPSSNHVSSLKPKIQEFAISEIDFTKNIKLTSGLNSLNGEISSVPAADKEVETEMIDTENVGSTNNVTMNEPIISAQSDKQQNNAVNIVNNVNGPEKSLYCSEKIPLIEYVHIPTPSNSTPIKENFVKADHSNQNVCRIPNTTKDIDVPKSPIIVTPQACTTSPDPNDDDDDVEIIGDFPLKPTPLKKAKNTLSKSSENSIVIENITNTDNSDPLKKTIRMKLGNGKTFKGTVSGSVDINELLDDPEIKSLLMTQFQQPKKLYSLKLNVNKDFLNGNKVVSAHIQPAIKPQTPSEIVSLLSDDEDDCPQIFETEYGKHKIDIINDDLFKKHQIKLKLKSYVLLNKLSVEEENATKNRGKGNVTKNNQILQKRVILEGNEKINLVSSLETPVPVNSKKVLNTNVLSAIPSKYVHGILKDFENIIVPDKEEPKTEPIVLIDDSSNDSEDIKNKSEPAENIDVLKNMLLKELGVEDQLIPVTRKSTDDVQVTWASEAIDLTDDSAIEQTDDQSQYKKNHQQIVDRKCFVKLVRCDGKINQLKRQPIDVGNDKYKENGDPKPAAIHRTGSFSLLENIPKVDDINKIETKQEHKRTSPVMEMYDLIASLKRQDLSTKKDEPLLGLSIQKVVVPTLATLVLSFIQKVDFVNKYIPKTRTVSLKRKSNESFPMAKIIKLNDQADKPQSSDCNILSTLIKESDDNLILAAFKTDEELKSNKNIMIDDLDVTPDLSDTDITSVTASDIDSDDNMAFTEKESEFDLYKVAEPHTGEHTISLNKILCVGKNLTACHEDNLADIVTESQENAIIDSLDNTPNHLLQAQSKTDSSIRSTKTSQNSAIEESHSNHSSIISIDDILLTTDACDRLDNEVDTEKEIQENENAVNSLEILDTTNRINCVDYSHDKAVPAPEKENIVRGMIVFSNNNALVETVKSLENNSLSEPNMDLEDSKTSIDQDISGVNLSDITITSPIYGKTNSKATTEVQNNTKADFKNMSDESIDKQRPKPEINVPEYFDQGRIDTPELKLIMNTTKISDAKSCFDSTTLKQENQYTANEINSNMNSTHFPKSDDEINDALNKMFGEPEGFDNYEIVLDEHVPDKTRNLIIEQGNYCGVNNSGENYKIIKEDNTVVPLENKSTNKRNTNLSRSIDEIDDALKKIFGELEDVDSTNVSEVVTTENSQKVSTCPISTMPNNENVELKAVKDYNGDEKISSLQEGLTLIEDSDNEIVVDNLESDVGSKLKILNQKIATKSDSKNIVTDFNTLSDVDDTVINDNVLDIFDNYLESNGKVEIKGIKYEDPVIGTRYVFSVIEEISEIHEQDSSIINESKENIAHNNCEHDLEIDNMKLIVPKYTYVYSKGLDNEIARRSSRNMKRKKDMADIKTSEKKYRKGKNIDVPKLTVSAMADSTYAKEYKRIMNYCSTIKFSYARPFHIDNIDVGDMLKAWPIKNSPAVEVAENSENRLYRDTEDTESAMAQTNPFTQTLNEEIINSENINYKSININETNFNMGFGEMSGRVIQKIETGITKLSAATLSDVKQYQPFSKSEVSIANQSYAHKVETQTVKMPHLEDLLNLKEKVRSFFKNTASVLNNELLLDKKYDTSDDLLKFPYGLTSTDFMEIPRVETVVNVVHVQHGHLPVSAAAQNPVTCDPRVTQVSDASPSQCSDNSTGEDTQNAVKTEYTELTTANITLPLVQEYAQSIHQSPLSQDESSPGTDDNMNESTQTLSIVKIELMEEENSQEKLENEIYENDFSPLPNNNIEYSFEDTSNTIFNTSVNVMHNTSSNRTTTSNHIFGTSNSMDNTFNNIFNSPNNMNSAYTDLENTPSSTESTYTNMDNASTSMYSTSPNVSSSSTKLDNTANIDDASPNMDNTYVNLYNPMRNESNDGSNTTDVGNTAATSINSSPINLENRPSNVNTTANMENTAYDYTYENIEDYAANIENNNNAGNYSTNANRYAASVENYTSNVDNFTSNVENFTTSDESYPTAVENYASNVESYSSNIENYPANGENYANNIDSNNSNINSSHVNIDTAANMLEEPQDLSMTNPSHESKLCNTFEDGRTSKPDQIAHAMNAAGISSESVITSGADELANLISQSSQPTANNNYSKASPINVVTLQQALAQVLTPPLNHNSTPENQMTNNAVAQQVLHIVQGNNAQTVINKPNGTHLLHIVQNKNNPATNNLSLVDAGLQQGGNQLIHIVNNGNQNNAQFLKRVNLLTNLTNAQGSNEQKMIQFVCKSADGKSIQLNAGHQRSMVLRLHPTTVQNNTPKPTEPQDLGPSTSAANSTNSQDPSQEIKSPSAYEENYAQFVQNSGPTPSSTTTPCQEKSTSLPKFNQVFGKQSYQESQNEMSHDGIQENSECPPEESNGDLEQTPDVNNPPLLVRSTPPETTQSQPNPVQQIKQTMSPMNIHTTMHGGVIYTRQIPVNIGGGQTINLITVPSTELVDDSAQKQQPESTFVNQEGEQSSIIKLVPHHTSNNPNVPPDENNTQTATSNETNQTPQPQPVLTQMRIKLPMLSKGPHIVPGGRLVRPSFFQIQRNVIAGTNQPVYQQLVLTTAPSLGQTIRLPAQQAQSPQAQPILVQSSPHPQSSPHIPVQQVQHAPSSQHALSTQQAHSAPATPQPQTVQPELTKSNSEPNSELSNLTLEQLREFDMVLEQVKERSVQPTPSTSAKSTPADSTDGPALESTSVCESTQQVLYSVDNSQPSNVLSYVNRKSTITSATTSFVRSPDSSGIVDTPSSSTQVQITRTVTTKSSTTEAGSSVVPHPKKKKKKKPPSSSSTLASLASPPKPNPLKPQEDEQTTQRILYILAEYKEQVENSPDKNKPAPRRRNQFPQTTGSKRKRSKCSSRSRCRRVRNNTSPTNGEHGEHGEDSITVGSEDSNGTTFSECTDCQENPPEESPTKVVRRLTFEQHETTTQITQTQTQSTPQRNVIVGDRQTITVARTTTATTAKPTATVLMPANYLLPVSMLKGGQQIAIMTNRGPKILVGAGDSNALLFQRLIGPGLKPVLTRTGVRHIRLPANALHNLQAFNIQTTPQTQVHPPDSTAPQAPMPGPPDLVNMRVMNSTWQDREAQDKPERAQSPDCTEPWNMPSSSIADDYGYEEIVRTDNMERTVLDAIPDRYSPDNMEAQQIFDKMFDVDSKKSMYDSSRCGYEIDTSDGDDKPYPQVVQQRKDGRHHRVTHVSTAALRHKYAILEHEMRLQKSLSEECEDLGVDSPSASDLFPEADILFGAPSPAHEQTIDHCDTPPPMIPLPQNVPQPDMDDQIATDQLLTHNGTRNDDLDLNLDDVGEIVTVGEDGVATIPTINAEEFARSHPNTTFHTEPEDGEIPPFTIAQGIKGRHITFHSSRVPGTVVMAPQTTVISQATVTSNDAHNTVKFIDIDNMINSMPCPQPVSVQSVLVKDTVVSSKPPKLENIKDSGTSASRSSSKFDNKEPTSHRSSSKSDSQKESRNSVSRSSSKFDSLKVPGTSSVHRSSSKFDSLKEPSTSRSTSKFDSLKDSVALAPKPLSKFDSLLTESKLHLSTNTSARHVVHSTGHGTQVIRRLRYDERTNTKTSTRYYDEPRERTSISDEVKMRNDRAMVESMGDNASSPGQPELFWDSTTTERHERRFHFSETEKSTKSPFDELLNDSSAYGPHTRLDSVIKAARPERTFERTSFEGISVSGSSDDGRPLRTYPPKRVHTQDTERHFTLKTTTTTTHHHELDRSTIKTTHHQELDRTKKMPRCQEAEGRRRTGRGLVKRNCSCCSGSSAPPKKRSRLKKTSNPDITPKTDSNLT